MTSKLKRLSRKRGDQPTHRTQHLKHTKQQPITYKTVPVSTNLTAHLHLSSIFKPWAIRASSNYNNLKDVSKAISMRRRKRNRILQSTQLWWIKEPLCQPFSTSKVLYTRQKIQTTIWMHYQLQLSLTHKWVALPIPESRSFSLAETSFRWSKTCPFLVWETICLGQAKTLRIPLISTGSWRSISGQIT